MVMCMRSHLSPSTDGGRSSFRFPTARHVVCRCAPSATPPVLREIEPVHITDAFYVRQLSKDDVSAIAEVQCNSFHEPARLFDSALKQMFKAEVLAGLREKMTVDPGTALLLVAVPRDRGVAGSPVAIVEMFLSNNPSILNSIAASGLSSEPPSVYGLVTSMAVQEDFRRQGCASALLEAVHRSLSDFGADWSALHVHSDNHSAVALYEHAGYHNLGCTDASWRKVLGSRERTLMVRLRE